MWEKGRFFDKNHGLAKCRFFSTVWELHFWGPKNFIFYPEYKKNVSFLLFCSKKKLIRKRSIFWQKPWTNPFAKCRFFSVFWNCSFLSKKHSFLSRIWKNVSFCFFFAQKKHMRKRSIFWQKPWTNPFAKCWFFSTFSDLHFWGPKSFIFYPEYQKMFLYGFFCSKKTYKKKVDFLTKTMNWPLWTMSIFFTVSYNFSFVV